MKDLKFIIIALSGIVSCLMGKAQVTDDRAKSAETELLAQKIVSQCANIKEGEFVLIHGGIRDMELLEDIVVNMAKRGGYPLLTIGSDRLDKKFYTEVPAVYDSRPPELAFKISGFIDAAIGIAYNEDPDLIQQPPGLQNVTPTVLPANSAVPGKAAFIELKDDCTNNKDEPMQVSRV